MQRHLARLQHQRLSQGVAAEAAEIDATLAPDGDMDSMVSELLVGGDRGVCRGEEAGPARTGDETTLFLRIGVHETSARDPSAGVEGLCRRRATGVKSCPAPVGSRAMWAS